MPTNLTNLTVDIGLTVRAAAKMSIDLAELSDVANLVKTLQLAFGSGAGKADQIWHDRSILAGPVSETLDLAGALINAFGQTVTFANIKAIALLNRSDEVLPGHPVPTDAPVSIAPSTNPFNGPLAGTTPKLIVPPGGVFLVTNPTAAGWPVTPGTGDEIEISNEHGLDQAIYDIILIGEEAA